MFCHGNPSRVTLSTQCSVFAEDWINKMPFPWPTFPLSSQMWKGDKRVSKEAGGAQSECRRGAVREGQLIGRCGLGGRARQGASVSFSLSLEPRTTPLRTTEWFATSNRPGVRGGLESWETPVPTHSRDYVLGFVQIGDTYPGKISEAEGTWQ